MKNFILSLLAVAASLPIAAERHVNPDYSFRTTAVIRPTCVERTEDATKISFHATFRPHNWIRVDSTAVIIDTKSGVRYTPVSATGLTLSKKFRMPDTGEADFTINFPPMPEGTDEVNFDDGSWKIFGLRLDGKKAAKTESIDFDRWEAEHHVTYPGEPSEFFKKADATITGVINGYNRQLGFDNALVYYTNSISGESTPKQIEIGPDGEFSISLPIVSPGYFSISKLGESWLQLYAEPGRTLELAIDWELLLQDNLDKRMGKNVNRALHFGGELGDINRELAGCPEPEYLNIFKLSHDIVPSEFMKRLNERDATYRANIEAYIKSSALNPVTIKLLSANEKGKSAYDLLDYAMYYRDHARTDSTAPSLKEPIGLDYFNTIKEILTENDKWFIAGESTGNLYNRLAFCELPRLIGAESLYSVYIPDTGIGFLKNLGAKLTKEEEETETWIEQNIGTTLQVNLKEMDEIYDRLSLANRIAERCGMQEKYSEYIQQSLQKGNSPDNEINDKILNADRQAQAMKVFASTETTPLLWQLTQAATFCSYGSLNPTNHTKDKVTKVLEETVARGVFTEPFLKSELNNFYTEAYNSQQYYLPDDKRGEVMRNLIAPHSGKILLVDFWSTGCGPCRANIERSASLRERNRQHPDFKMIFITGDDESPEDAYRKYVEKNLADETCHRIPQSDYNRLRDLFKFNGIPRYILIDRDGKILNDNFNLYSLSKTLSDYGVTLM